MILTGTASISPAQWMSYQGGPHYWKNLAQVICTLMAHNGVTAPATDEGTIWMFAIQRFGS